MKHLSYNFREMAICLLCVIGALASSCSKENEIISQNGRTTTIRLHLPILESISRVNVSGDENAVNHLRVIILSQGAESINQTFETDKITDGTIEISEVPVGLVQIYVIANEASLGKNYNDLAELQKEVDQDIQKVLIKDENRTYFPCRSSKFPSAGLPMSWMDKNLTIEPPSGTPQTITVDLVRAVAKLNIQMSNALTTPITIDQMSFGPFFGDRLYLFAEGALDVPDENLYESHDFPLPTGETITIEGGQTEQLVLYIYPSFAWTDPNSDSPYTIGFHTEAGIRYPQMAFVKGGTGTGALNSIARNTQVNIYATLSAESNINIAFEAVEWDSKTVNVPSFN